jgi:hypothetical protein
VPDADTGVVLSGTQRVLGLRVEDGDGGPPWGLRVSATTRGLGCLLPGRVADGRIGVYGRYGAFGDDGRLHPFPADIVAGPNDCVPLDADGRLFMSASIGNAQASASRTRVCPRVSGTLCAPGTERYLLYGLLGPAARTITYTTPAGPKTIRAVGSEGAYLIVLPTRDANFGAGLSRAPMDQTITAVTFRDGTRCDAVQLRTQQCTLPGFHARAVKALTHEDVAAKVRATARQGRRFWNMTVAFRAPVAIPDATAAFTIRMFPPGHTGRSAWNYTRRNYARGDLVTMRFQHLNGGGEYRIVVGYAQATEPGRMPSPQTAVTVGRARLRIP